MNYSLAQKLIDQGYPLSRSVWEDRRIIVFRNKHSEIVKRAPNQPQFPFDASDEDLEASDWEIGTRT